MQIPLQDWARALVDARHAEVAEDGAARSLQAVGRTARVRHPVRVRDRRVPGVEAACIVFDIGGPHSFRIIYMDGRAHPKDLKPSYYGHSVGRWEGETLVVDAVGFNEKFWMSRDGLPHTDRLHLTERFTRTDFNTLKYEVTVDDPGAYTAPWTSGFALRWTAGHRIVRVPVPGQ